MIKVAVLGLTGDPLTLGHMEIAKGVGESRIVDEVWFQPCWKHRFGKQPISAFHRMQMAELACDALGAGYHPSYFEVLNQFEGGTYLLFQAMKLEFPEYEFYHIIGMDNANSIDKWAFPEKLKSEVPFIVCNRQGVKEEATWFKQPPHQELHISLHYEISSTVVREKLIGNDNSISEYLDPTIYQYIQDHNLYR